MFFDSLSGLFLLPSSVCVSFKFLVTDFLINDSRPVEER